MRIVLDTNFLIRAHREFDSLASHLHKVLVRDNYQILVSNELLGEVTRVLRYPKMQRMYGLSDDSLYEYIQFLRITAEFVRLDPLYIAPMRDPSDLIILQTAERGRADIICTATTATFAATTASAATGASDAKTQASIVDADATGQECVMTFNGQVVDRATAKLGLADNGTEMSIGIYQTVIAAERVDFDERIELVEYPVVWGGIKMLTAPERVANNALAFVLVNLEDLGFVDFAGVVEAQNPIARLQFVNSPFTTRSRSSRFKNLPAALRGSGSVSTTTCDGTLNAAIFPSRNFHRSAGAIDCPTFG